MKIGKQAIRVNAHKIIDVNEELHDYGVLCARFKINVTLCQGNDHMHRLHKLFQLRNYGIWDDYNGRDWTNFFI